MDILEKQTGSQVQADRAAASVEIAQAQVEMAAQLAEIEKQKLEQRHKIIKMVLIGAGVLILIKVLK